MKIISVVNI